MKTLCIMLHGFVLLLGNLVGVFVGFLIYRALGAGNQLGTQLPVAGLVSVLLYLGWVVFLGAFGSDRFGLGEVRAYVLVGVCALVWNPVVFVPLHYVTQGYLSDPGNIVGLGAFQIPVNVVALLVARYGGKQSRLRLFTTKI